MNKEKYNDTVLLNGKPHKKHVLLADANLPHKFCMNRKDNTMFFCINADQSVDQTFQSGVLELDSNRCGIIPSVRNGFACAVNQLTGEVYLGGSQGIFKYNPSERDVYRNPLIGGVDILDMFYMNGLYFVDTAFQRLQMLKDHKGTAVPGLADHLIQHFVIDDKSNIIFISSGKVYMVRKKKKVPQLIDDREIVYRGATIDSNGIPHVIAYDGVYKVDVDNVRLEKIFTLHNGYGIAFDRDNNLIYSDERSVIKLVPIE